MSGINTDHAIIQKRVLNLDHGVNGGPTKYVYCAWDDCDRDGFELHKVRVNYGKTETPHIISYVFCSDRHKQYWINSHRSYGNLPAGFKLSTI